jgi:hypothetical protein
MPPFLVVASLVFCVIFEEVVQLNERFLFISLDLWQVIGLFFKTSLHVPLVHPILTTHGKILQPHVFINA